MAFRRVLLSGLVLTTIGACGVFGSDDPPPPTEEQDGGAGPPAPPPPIAGTPIVGVFVSASKGLPDGDGTMNRPTKTIAAAMEIAKQRNVAVIVCAETFNEQVKLVDGVTLYGFFDCIAPEWKRTEAHATIASPTSPAVLAEGLSRNARFEGFDIVGPDIPSVAAPNAVATTSYGMLVTVTRNFEMGDVNIRAGRAQDGADGANPAQGNVEQNPASVSQGAPALRQRTTCPIGACELLTLIAGQPGGASKCAVGGAGGPGGQGGDGPLSYDGSYKADATNSATGRPGIGSAATAPGGAVHPGLVGFYSGVTGGIGAAGANGVTMASTFDNNGYVPGNGTAGTMGSPGQGGGGGAGAAQWWAAENAKATQPPISGWGLGAAGGGGGAGGCAGLPGVGGTGGGASIGLAVLNSEISITKARIEGLKGGRGGKGSFGTVGTPGNPGGVGGKPNVLIETRPDGLYGAPGGAGGDGGPAGLSGHGSSGMTIGLAFKGQRPKTTDVTLLPGNPADGYPEATRGTQKLPAVVGEALPERQF